MNTKRYRGGWEPVKDEIKKYIHIFYQLYKIYLLLKNNWLEILEKQTIKHNKNVYIYTHRPLY